MSASSAPTIRTNFPYDVEVLDNVWIPLADGTRLAARIWLPVGAGNAPVPAILEAIPYRKDDVTAVDDAVRHGYFAGYGYASIRLDLRGSGNSSGVLLDEYHEREQDDLVEVIGWIADQPWCSGRVGMTGISWSGFNSLQVAARRPPALKAIITVCSSDDRYDNDVHYMGGVVLAFYMLVWANVMLAFNARPPDPDLVGESWREIWLERLEGSPFLIEQWLGHQRRDAYWQRGSVCEDYAAIECPVLAVGGWSDAYTDTVLRLLEHLPGVRKGIIGPWGHTWPERGVPGPAIGFLQECLRWWDRWLRDEPTGVEDEPALRAFVQDAYAPRPDAAQRSGRWISLPTWPAESITSHELILGERRLIGTVEPEGELLHSSPLTLGLDSGSWCPYGNPTDLPADQRHDDAYSLGFDGEPLDEPLTIVGQPELELELSSDVEAALVVVRICDVGPSGSSTMVARGALNLTHRNGHASPEPLVPGARYRASVPCKAVAYTIPAGHRLRVSLSTSYWPFLWPSPRLATLTIVTGSASRLRLPILQVETDREPAPRFGRPEIAPPPHLEQLRERRPLMTVTRDVQSGAVSFHMERDLFGEARMPSGIVYRDTDPISFEITDGDPLSARVECSRSTEVSRGEWKTRIETRCLMTSTETAFHVSSQLDAFEGETRILTRSHAIAIPRDGG